MRPLILAALGSLALTACSLAVETSSLGNGQSSNDCRAHEKLCPYESSDPNGIQACVDATSPNHGCGTGSCSPCELVGAIPRCTQSGACGVAICLDGYADCDADERTGCEARLSLDEDNCGSCGHSCAISHGAADCVKGVCEVVYCEAPFANCVALNGDADGDGDTCETNTDESKEHCGKCNSPCAGTCEGGRCVR
jgi:hypothetical protein